jgi:hypothetical protein
VAMDEDRAFDSVKGMIMKGLATLLKSLSKTSPESKSPGRVADGYHPRRSQ